MNARNTAVARQQDQIDQSVARVETQRRHSALELMASRLNVSSTGLKNTLLNTVFKKASDEEFMALVIVANAYNLNPLTKEIYAFPAKGGGIVPIVSIDGWLRIMNEHPQFDGIEFEDMQDEKGKIFAVEATIWRKDRTRPIKVIEYLEECKQNTDPWRNLPNRMLRHKATIQAARYAFGFSGISDDGDSEFVGDITLTGENVGTPMRSARAIEHREEVAHDAETGEIIDETQRDAQGVTKTDDEVFAEDIIARFRRVEIVPDFNVISSEYGDRRRDLPSELVNAIDVEEDAARDRLTKKGGE